MMYASDFVPGWDRRQAESSSREQHERELLLHLMPLNLSFVEQQQLIRTLNLALKQVEDNYFTLDPTGTYWLLYDRKPVNCDADFKWLLINALSHFEAELKYNWNRLTDDKRLSVYVKADSALLAAYLWYFTGSETPTGLTCDGQPVKAREKSGVNMNEFIDRALWYFGDFLNFNH